MQIWPWWYPAFIHSFIHSLSHTYTLHLSPARTVTGLDFAAWEAGPATQASTLSSLDWCEENGDRWQGMSQVTIPVTLPSTRNRGTSSAPRTYRGKTGHHSSCPWRAHSLHPDSKKAAPLNPDTSLLELIHSTNIHQAPSPLSALNKYIQKFPPLGLCRESLLLIPTNPRTHGTCMGLHPQPAPWYTPATQISA